MFERGACSPSVRLRGHAQPTERVHSEFVSQQEGRDV
ncbi:hypothetical protein Spb1_35260 [Planctopirus ephydatiae]|uniref:Uncharacterized protein n=1 Tax=Planctopirus ephydatiae TaxID=2528019 RepID=A0A518GSM7_9PLAN|nr:hypothetical protein Spb1_35260 [Planctopirus ephydatiae]